MTRYRLSKDQKALSEPSGIFPSGDAMFFDENDSINSHYGRGLKIDGQKYGGLSSENTHVDRNAAGQFCFHFGYPNSFPLPEELSDLYDNEKEPSGTLFSPNGLTHGGGY